MFFKKNGLKVEKEGKKRGFKKALIVLLVVLLAGASFWSGMVVGYGSEFIREENREPGSVENKESLPEHLSEDIDFSLFWNLWNLLKEEYYKQPVAETKLFYGAMMGMVAALEDPHSVYLDPEVTQKFTRELSGSYEGIGAEIGIRNGRLTIIAPLPDTPASRAGLRAGDKVLAIDDRDTTGISLDLAVSLIRGEKKTPVILTVIRKDADQPEEITIVRDTIDIKAVNWEMRDDGIAYFEITYFNENATSEFKKAVVKAMGQNPRGIILDLRNNPGGFLDEAIDITGFWIEDDLAVIERFRGGEERQYRTEGSALLKDIKTVVLVNGGSASGSEIVAGALQDYQKAVLVGQKTFGKGSVQEFKHLDDGSAVKLTVAEWLTPLGRSINEEGITPDIEIEYTREDFDSEEDPQMDKALEIIEGAAEQP